jgi:hypothetical protein
MLSSIAQQKDAPELITNIAYAPGNGKPTTEAVCDLFSKKMRVKQTVCSMEDIKFRGLIRNRQLAETDADWMLFADSDMVYDPLFFYDLGLRLAGDLRNEEKCISASRISLDKDACNQAVRAMNLMYPIEVENAAEAAAGIPVNRGQGRGVGRDGVTRNVGAGYFQLANVNVLRAKFDGLYWDPKGRRDPSWGYRSDRQFRRRVGGTCPIITKPQYHLNHERDSDVGEHVEIQR